MLADRGRPPHQGKFVTSFPSRYAISLGVLLIPMVPASARRSDGVIVTSRYFEISSQCASPSSRQFRRSRKNAGRALDIAASTRR